MDKNDEVDDADTRHLSEEGAALIASARRNGILQEEWCFNPAEEGYGDSGGEFHSEEDNGHSQGSGMFFDDEAHMQDESDIQDEDTHLQGGEISADNPEEMEEDEGEIQNQSAICRCIVYLDDSNTGGMNYQFWVELTNTANNETRTIEFDTLVREEDVTAERLEQALSSIFNGEIHLESVEIEYV